jgi:hypothetical protein
MENQMNKHGIVNTYAVYVRDGVGKEYNPLRSIPFIEKGDEIEILDTIEGTDGEDWYHARIKDDIYGYVKAEFIDIK